METIITELSKYLIIILMILFTFQCFTIFKKQDPEDKQQVLRKQIILMLFMNFVAYAVLYMNTQDIRMIFMYIAVFIFIAVVQILYRVIYRKGNLLIVNNMCMLLSIGFLILSRLNFDKAVTQFEIVVAGMALSFVVPVIVRKVKLLKDLTWLYGIVGIGLLGVVLVMAAVSGGAKLSITVGGITLQLSEIVKITFVFFVAGMLREDTSFRQVVITTIVAGAHVLILVVSKDLGSAVVFFVAYLVMLYVATKKVRYALAGLAGGSAAAVLAYFMFNHVRQRVVIWKDPIAVYDKVGGGYQTAQGLFGISAGGWFGMGLGEGMPDIIPVVTKDFIFAAICEELGAVFAICMLLVCMSLFLMIVNVSMKMSKPFYKLIAMGLGAEYAFQVFLTVGGSCNFIPMTGITLPLVSYGGSSVICTIMMLAIIQGLYILREDEGEELERQKRERENLKKSNGRMAEEEMVHQQEELHSGKKPSKKKSRNRQKKASTGKEYVIIAYSFVAVFLALIGYLVYFNVELRDTYANSPYNSKRQGTYQERVIKGEIRAAGGEVLASTKTNEEGKEFRLYPYEDVFAHVVGYSATGISGLEQSMNSQLLTAHGNLLEQVEDGFKNQKSVGDNVISTLDVKLQKAAYDALGDRKGAIVVMEPDTGKILAMVSKPDFNPNTIARDWEKITADKGNSSLVNRATQGQYPPGSTFKIITALAYWRQHNTFDGFDFNCTGEVENGGYTIHCYHNTAHGQLDFPTAFAKSCNTAFAQIGVDLNKEEYRATVEDLLFNQKLPLDMQYRKSSFELDGKTPDALAMQTAIGQGNTLVSPMHMAMITAAVANGGDMMTPYLVDRIETCTGGNVKTYQPKTYKKVMTSQEASRLSELMAGVAENGTARSLSGKGYTVAGKTGTAEHGDVSVTTPHSWFVGFSNVENPDIAVSVLAEESGAGSEVAVPIAGKIFDAYYAR